MCGRYAASASPEDLVEELDVVSDQTGGQLVPSFNLAPTQPAPVVLERRPRDQPDADPVRQLRVLTWGLVPSWAKDPKIGSRMINARAETLLDKPAYRRAALTRRCLVPADGWYEWQASPTARDAKGKPRKQPFFIHLGAGGGLVLAGVYEFWRDPALADDDPLAWRTTYAVVTTEAEPGLDRIHDRMPVVLTPDRWGPWLDPHLDDPDTVWSLLAPQPPGRFAAHPVSRRVGNVASVDAGLVDPAPADELVGVVDPMTGEVLAG